MSLFIMKIDEQQRVVPLQLHARRGSRFSCHCSFLLTAPPPPPCADISKLDMMADWSQLWVPCDYPLAADWTMEPAALPGLPVECQTSGVLATSGQQQVVAPYAAATTEEDKFYDEVEHTIVHDEVEIKIHDDAIHVFKEAAQLFDSNIKKLGVKMHRYPISLKQYLSNRHSVPSTVAIGPYHHGLPELQEAEKVKHVAAYHCIEQSGHSVQDMYDAVVLDTDYARSLYDKNVVVGISDNDFQPMMFYDACFLVQYMLSCTLDGYNEMDKSLRSFFNANEEAIFNDVMMLENQIPWQVVETLMKFRDVPLESVAGYARGYLQDRKVLEDLEPVTLDDSYKPPHLLGFLRFYMVGRGRRRNTDDVDTKQPELPESVSFSVSAIELAEMGIEVKASRSKELIAIGINEGQHDLSLPQVSLDDSRTCILVNMAAFELCTIPDFLDADAADEDSAICSYLQLLAMVLDKAEDVQELRRKHVLQGGGGLTNEQVLEFFNCLQDLRLGSRYIRTMVGIENYKLNNKVRVLRKSFVYNYGKTVVAVFGAIATLASILGTIISFKKGNGP